MKIAVVTVHDSANFGSFLQAYALEAFLKKHGHEVCFVKTRDEKYIRGLYYSFRPTREWIKHPFRVMRGIVNGIRKYRLFTREQSCFTVGCDNPDLTILGSDEIWNVRTPVFNYPIFYGDGAKNTVAYGVSAGLAQPSDFDSRDELKRLIKNIDTPLVRDENTADCVEKITGIRPPVVCDPTLLADSSIFMRDYRNSYLDKNPYMLVYTYQPEPRVVKIFRDFAKSHGLKLVSAGFWYDWCDYNVHCAPLELSAVMQKAEYVITTTFHGTIFSVLNHKRFVSVPISGKTTDLLSRLGLDDCCVSFSELNSDVLERKLVKSCPDYNAVDDKIADFRKKSEILILERIDKYENM